MTNMYSILLISVLVILNFSNLSLLGNEASFSCYCDAAEPWAYGFQESASPQMEGIVDFHDHLFYFLILILVSVTWVIALIVLGNLKKRNSGSPFLKSNYSSQSAGKEEGYINQRVNDVSLKDLNHHSVLEIVWTLTPAVILVLIAFPSFKLLYLMDEIVEPLITVKAIGHQWYWSYEYTDTYEGGLLDSQLSNEINFDSYMKTTDSLEAGELRLLETDNKVVLPIDTRIRIVTTGADVIHSWAVPSLGVKIDAIPGRLNQVSLDINREGTFFGQCSELCGVNHGFMPIQIEAVSLENYVEWLYAYATNS